MKQLLFLLMAGAVLATPRMAQACDVCGCSGGGGYFGILPQFQRHFVGMRWQERVLDSYSPATSLESASNGHSVFRTLDLWGRWYPLRRLQILAFMPVHFFEQTENESIVRTRGLGNASLMANYTVFNTGDSLMRIWKHSFQIGGGVQLPTGPYRLTDSDGVRYHANLQPGTGSTDALINLIYTLRRGRVGMQVDAQTRINTTNANQYRFGNRQNAALRLFWWKKLNNTISILPRAGVSLDVAQKDVWYDSRQRETGGSMVFADVGADVYLGNLAIGAGFQKPLQYNLGTGGITPRGNLNISATWAFGREKKVAMPVVPAFRNVALLNQ